MLVQLGNVYVFHGSWYSRSLFFDGWLRDLNRGLWCVQPLQQQEHCPDLELCPAARCYLSAIVSLLGVMLVSVIYG